MKNEYKGYRVGDRIRMIQCGVDPQPIPPLTKGTCDSIDSLGTLHMRWDNGRTLGVVLEVDTVEKVPLLDEFVNFDKTSTIDCLDEAAWDAHARRAYAVIDHMEQVAADSGGAWVVRRSYVDHGHAAQPVLYDYVQAGDLMIMLEGADIKNGVDAGFSKTGQNVSFTLVTYGQGYTSPDGGGIVAQAFECKLLKKQANRDFEERLQAGWSDRGEGPQKMYFSSRDQQSLIPAIQECQKMFRSKGSRDLER